MEIAIIVSCSKNKQKGTMEASRLYTGQFFSLVSIIAKRINADLYILSAKYGLIPSTKVISDYDQRINSHSDIQRVKQQSDFSQLDKYHYVVLFMGDLYTKVFEDYTHAGLITTEDHRGSGGYLQIVSMLKNQRNPKMIKMFFAYSNASEQPISTSSIADYFEADLVQTKKTTLASFVKSQPARKKKKQKPRKSQIIYISKKRYKELERKATPRKIDSIKEKLPKYKTERGKDNALKRLSVYEPFWEYQNYLMRSEQWDIVSDYKVQPPLKIYKIKDESK